jgi:hypothetical protein
LSGDYYHRDEVSTLA